MKTTIAILLAVATAGAAEMPPPIPAVELVLVPRAQIEALRQERAVMKATIDEQNRQLERIADVALLCAARFDHAEFR